MFSNKIDLPNVENLSFDGDLVEIKKENGSFTMGLKEAAVINTIAAEVHKANKKWWVDLETGESIRRNKAEMMMLIVSEIAEAMEGHRKNLMDDKLPHRPMEEVEMADALIRILDYCAGHKLDLGGAYVEKMAYNATRKDHTREERLKDNGKKF